MRHVLVSSEDEALASELRGLFPPEAVLVSASGVEETLELLARSARVDAVVTDDPEAAAAIREEVPGNLPVVLVPAGAPPRAVLALLERALPGL